MVNSRGCITALPKLKASTADQRALTHLSQLVLQMVCFTSDIHTQHLLEHAIIINYKYYHCYYYCY